MTRVIVTGAPGTGKTSLLESLTHLGTIIAEPARELIAEHRAATGQETLDDRPEHFVAQLVARSIDKFEAGEGPGVALYDRGLPDCVAYARLLGVDAGTTLRAALQHRYANPVLLAPPWQDIYTTDGMRRATFDQVEAFHDELVTAYVQLGYDLVELPRQPLEHRARVVAAVLENLRRHGRA